MRSSGKARKPMCGAHEGPARLVATRGYSTTMAISTLQKLLAAQVLRRGDGAVTTPASRRKERLFGAAGCGRTSVTAAGVNFEKLGADYDPRNDTCMKAFVRLLAARAEEEASAAALVSED